jgi:hypothetical protein
MSCFDVVCDGAGAVQKTMQDFVRESELMADLRHPNIVCLIGVCMQEEPKVLKWCCYKKATDTFFLLRLIYY